MMGCAIVAGGFGGDMDDTLADTILDDLDFDDYGRIVCPEIQARMPWLNARIADDIAEIKAAR